MLGFPHNSVSKESACNAGDPGWIPRSGKPAGEGTGYPPQYSWAPLVAHLENDPPAMWETWVRSLGWEDPLEKGKATHPSILACRIPWTSARLSDFHFLPVYRLSFHLVYSFLCCLKAYKFV